MGISNTRAVKSGLTEIELLFSLLLSTIEPSLQILNYSNVSFNLDVFVEGVKPETPEKNPSELGVGGGTNNKLNPLQTVNTGIEPRSRSWEHHPCFSWLPAGFVTVSATRPHLVHSVHSQVSCSWNSTKQRLYLSANVFSTVVLIGGTVNTEPCIGNPT